MFEKFDFSWFLTTPGILTMLGCLLILISIIIFISSLRGNKKKEVPKTSNESIPDNIGSAEVEQNSTPPEVTPVETAPVTLTPEVTPVEVAPVTVTPEVTPVEVAPVTVTPEVTPVEVAPVTVTPEVTPVEVAPVTVTPEVTPVEIKPMNVTGEVSYDNTAAAQKTFAGINIEPNIQPVPVTTNQEPRVIYGGADPLEGTGIIPKTNTQTKAEDIESL